MPAPLAMPPTVQRRVRDSGLLRDVSVVADRVRGSAPRCRSVHRRQVRRRQAAASIGSRSPLSPVGADRDLAGTDASTLLTRLGRDACREAGRAGARVRAAGVQHHRRKRPSANHLLGPQHRRRLHPVRREDRSRASDGPSLTTRATSRPRLARPPRCPRRESRVPIHAHGAIPSADSRTSQAGRHQVRVLDGCPEAPCRGCRSRLVTMTRRSSGRRRPAGARSQPRPGVRLLALGQDVHEGLAGIGSASAVRTPSAVSSATPAAQSPWPGCRGSVPAKG